MLPSTSTLLTVKDKEALGLPTTRCACRSNRNWAPFYHFRGPEQQLIRIYYCTKCNEQVEHVVQYHYGRLSAEPSAPKVKWTDEMRLHLMETPIPVDWGDDLPRELAPPEGHGQEGVPLSLVRASLDAPSPLHPHFREAV